MRLLVVALDWVATKLGLELACAQHPFYHGKTRKPKVDCTVCALLHAALK